MAEMITVSSVEDGTRLLRWFLRHFPSMPQREFYRLCRGGQIRVNSRRCHGREVLRAGDAIRVPPTIAEYAKAPKKTESGEHFSLSDLEQLRRAIIHNDDDIVVFNKPAGLAVQGGTGKNILILQLDGGIIPAVPSVQLLICLLIIGYFLHDHPYPGNAVLRKVLGGKIDLGIFPQRENAFLFIGCGQFLHLLQHILLSAAA